MPLLPLPGPQVVLVQIKIICRDDDDKETMQALDIPVRDPGMFDMELDTDMYNVHLDLNVRVDPGYNVQYVIRDQRAASEDGELHPYRDGIYSETDVAGIRAGLEFEHRLKTRKLRKQIKKLLKQAR